MIKTMEGVKVLDFSLAAAGPFCTRMLGACGAEVTLVEPLAGSHSRILETSDYILAGKRSVPLDAKSPEGQEVLHRLIKESDVFVSNYRPKALTKLGLSYEDVSAINPQIIYATLTGFGASGPMANAPGWDATAFFGRGTVLHTFSDGDTGVAVPADMMGDICASMGLWGAICSGLAYRARTGKGINVYNSLLETALFLNNASISHTQLGSSKYPESRAKPFRALRNVYYCKDGKSAIITLPTLDTFLRVLEATGRGDECSKFTDIRQTMNDNAPAAVKLLDEIFGERTLEEALKLFEDLDLSAEAVMSVDDCLTDPQVEANRMMYDVFNAAKGRTVKLPELPPVKFGEDENESPAKAPRLGEHSVEVLQELKFTEAEIADMLAKGITLDGSKEDLYQGPSEA